MRLVGTTCALLALTSCGGGDGGGGSSPDLTPVRALSLTTAPVLAGCGTPTVDGVLSPGEWDRPIAVRFALELPEELPGGPNTEVRAEVMAQADDRNLYVAFRLGDDLSVFDLGVDVGLDADESGDVNDGDDGLSFFWAGGGGGPAVFRDAFFWSCFFDPGYQTLCNTSDGDGWLAELLDGTADGGGAIHFADGETTLELWHPYDGGDPRDVLRTAGQSIPMRHSLFLSSRCDADDPACVSYGYPRTLFPSTGGSDYPTSGWYHSFLLGGCSAPPPSPQVVEIRVGAPGNPLPIVEIGESWGPVTAALMGSEDFDVAGVDASTLFLANAPVERDGRGQARATVEDVDGDGVDDLVALFGNGLDYPSGDGEMTLAGRTRDGRLFYGTNIVRTVYTAP